VSHFSTVLKTALPAAALACSLTLAAPGQATQFFLQADSMNTSRTAHIYGPSGFHEYVYIAPIKFTAYYGTGSTQQTGATSGPFDVLGFCVDIFHDIGLGPLNLKYDDNYDLETNSKYLDNAHPFTGATTLSVGQLTQVGSLVHYGYRLYNQGPNTTDTVNRLAAVQGAIWQVVNPGYSVVSGNVALDGYIASYSGANYASALTGYGSIPSSITFITETGKYGTANAHQSFALAGPAPEPTTWALMIVGFGLTGAVLRQSRRRLVAVRA